MKHDYGKDKCDTNVMCQFETLLKSFQMIWQEIAQEYSKSIQHITKNISTRSHQNKTISNVKLSNEPHAEIEAKSCLKEMCEL